MVPTDCSIVEEQHNRESGVLKKMRELPADFERESAEEKSFGDVR